VWYYRMYMPKVVTKAVIAAAGFGTRFLPQTKAMPKEMLPVVDKPIIQYVVEELVASGIKDIIIITGYNKRNIEDHFDSPNQDLVNNLRIGKKFSDLKEIERISDLANFIYIRQKGPYGNATPVLSAAHLVSNEPFIYTYADEFFVAKPSHTKQMIDVYRKNGGSVLACKRISQPKEYERYGIVGGQKVDNHLLKVNKIIEKPGKSKAPSDFASVGGYLLAPEIVGYIEQIACKVKSGKELMLQPAIQAMIDDGLPVYACEIQKGTYYDTGNKLEYLKTVVEFALKHKDLNKDFKAYLRTISL